MDMNAAELGRVLRAAAAADAPPTGIDLDGLIGAEQRRQRSLRTAGVACAAFAVLMVITVVLGLSGRPSATGQQPAGPGPATPSARAALPPGSPRPCPSLAATGPARPYQSGAPSPRPVPESCGEATGRLDRALAGALHTHAPGVTFHDVLGPDQAVRFRRANDDNLAYAAGLSLSTASGRGSMSVSVEPRTYRPQSEAELRNAFGCDRPSAPTTCIYRIEPDGTVVVGVLAGSPQTDGGHQYQIEVFRTDATLVRLIVSNTYYEGTPDPQTTPKLGGSQPPLTLDQIIAIGRDAGLTLYP